MKTATQSRALWEYRNANVLLFVQDESNKGEKKKDN